VYTGMHLAKKMLQILNVSDKIQSAQQRTKEEEIKVD
jgi:hypothetical protein